MKYATAFLAAAVALVGHAAAAPQGFGNQEFNAGGSSGQSFGGSNNYGNSGESSSSSSSSNSYGGSGSSDSSGSYGDSGSSAASSVAEAAVPVTSAASYPAAASQAAPEAASQAASQAAPEAESYSAAQVATEAATAASSSAAAANAGVSVTGTAPGFAASATGGGSAAAVTPTTTDELVSYLGDDEARVIVLTQTFDFTDSEGTTTGTGCAPWGTATGCQEAINQDDWCTDYEPDAPTVDVEYYTAGVLGITVGSNKSIVGSGTSGVIKGKGLRIVSGAENVIIQNIAITDINAKYVWGGDAITIDESDLVWIDHVTTARIGRQHIVLGTEADNRVTISNHFFDGETDYSATCDGHTYWNAYFDGSSDQITFVDNYLYMTSGRAPKVAGSTIVHAANNYWYDNSGHAFETDDGVYVLLEGNVFDNVTTIVDSDYNDGALFAATSDNASDCEDYIGRACVANSYTDSGSTDDADTSVLEEFESYSSDVYDAAAASTDIASSAGQGN
ncbi:hypothetical protein ASPZODRAFT_70393 [Penicilliopsis zonata CBS 506.65]|uniref:pectin lyase n=1 Tax=Penicilliopsis zonata CBS 506.65 TaxID=1073090 RepID=A0A1L9SD27_9EURO|nr:hypothetical protein ASPZODRAFT_70393 [Penicilliopsis zonata CBS 506.65]OJJ45081.1 hypothetical protein ASPZODRAFT_70393 [Penicilliopsis zonata CBS 506.65]